MVYTTLIMVLAFQLSIDRKEKRDRVDEPQKISNKENERKKKAPPVKPIYRLSDECDLNR